MKRVIVVTLGTALAGLGLSAQGNRPRRAAQAAVASRVAAQTAGAASSESQNALIKRYCVTACHNDTAKRGNLSLATFDVGHPDQNPAVAEKMIRKLRAGMMPPTGMPR